MAGSGRKKAGKRDLRTPIVDPLNYTMLSKLARGHNVSEKSFSWAFYEHFKLTV